MKRNTRPETRSPSIHAKSRECDDLHFYPYFCNFCSCKKFIPRLCFDCIDSLIFICSNACFCLHSSFLCCC
jgi:hypothetical protein